MENQEFARSGVSELSVGLPDPRSFVVGRFEDSDELARASAPWGIEFRQLDAGPAQTVLMRASGHGALVQRASFSRRYDQRGEAPAGCRSFGFLEAGVRDTFWCGRPMSDGELALFGASGAFEGASGPGFACITLSFDEVRLAEAAEMLGAPEVLARVSRGDRMFRVGRTALEALRRRVRRLLGSLESSDAPMDSAALEAELAFGIPASLVGTLATAALSSRRPSPRLRDRALARARAFMEAHLHQSIGVRDVCRASGASWRTLDYAFREHFGVGPKAHLQALRLNEVRRELRAAGPGMRVLDVASRWGFMHPGQFAADYRKLFGELPSQTLRSSHRPARAVSPGGR